MAFFGIEVKGISEIGKSVASFRMGMSGSVSFQW